MKSDYYERQEQRRERLQRAAARAEANAQAAYRKSTEGLPPMGEPIKIGHHSENRHRNALKRANQQAHKSVAEDRRAQQLRDRAAGVGSAGISSDAPDALAQLRQQLADLEANQANMKAANRIIRKKPKNENTGYKRAELAELGINESMADRLFRPNFGGRVGFPDYALQNNNANIRRIKARIAQLEAAESAETVEYERAGVKVVESVEDNRLQLFFDGKPAYEVRQTLKSNGFRWARSLGCWQRQLNNGARFAADQVLKSLEREGQQ